MSGSDDVMFRAFLPPEVPGEIRRHVEDTLAPILARLGARGHDPASGPGERP